MSKHCKPAAPTRALNAAVVLLCLLIAPQSQAQNGHAQLSTAVRDYVESFFAPSELRAAFDGEDLSRRVEIELSNLDPRLPVPVCELPLQTQINQNQRPVGRMNVKVDCAGVAPWSKYVPVTVRVFEHVLTSVRPLARGEVLSSSDVMMMEMDVSTVRTTYMHSADEAIGMELKRSLQANAPLVREPLAAPILVKRGDTVMITARTGSIEIRQQAVALQNGELGKQITVRNTNSDNVVQATVTGHGQASVGF
jgi:flagella basal body P-ring formation protein FlgA